MKSLKVIISAKYWYKIKQDFKNKNHILLSGKKLTFVFVFLFFVADVISQTKITHYENIQPLKIGDTIPEAIWSMPLQIINHPEGKDTITLNDYRDKELIIIDFWATWCVPCIKSIKHIDSLLSVFDTSKVCLLPVTRYDNENRMKSFIEKVGWEYFSVINNTTLDTVLLSSYLEYLGVVWIKDNKLFAVPKKKSLTHENILNALIGQSKDGEIFNYELRLN